MKRCVKCPQCNPLGILVMLYTEDNVCREIQLGCPLCLGNKVVSKECFRRFIQESEMWCDCKDILGIEFIPNFKSQKHAYKCKKCGKIIQLK